MRPISFIRLSAPADLIEVTYLTPDSDPMTVAGHSRPSLGADVDLGIDRLAVDRNVALSRRPIVNERVEADEALLQPTRVRLEPGRRWRRAKRPNASFNPTRVRLEHGARRARGAAA